MQVKEITLVGKRKAEGLSHDQLMMSILDIDLLTYNTKVYETGMEFLDDIFPESDPIYKQYNNENAFSANYWKWFRNEWFLWSKSLLSFCNDHGVKMTFDYWSIEMRAMAFDHITQDSFQNYLKLLR